MTDMIKSLYNIFLLFILSLTLLAGCGGGGGGASSGTNGDPTPQENAISAPAGVVAIGGINKVTLSWYAVPDATSYNIYWSNTSDVSKTKGFKISGATNPYNHIDLTNGTQYFYVVTAVNSHGESSESSPVSATPQALDSGSPPLAPDGVVATAVGNQININWNNVADATSYNLYWSTASDPNKTKIEVGNGISYAHPDLTPGTTYYYIVTALNDYGESVESNPVVSATISDIGTLHGYIKDAITKGPLQGVAVNIFDSYSTISASRATNTFGGYTATLTMGTYSMSTSKNGYIPEKVSNIRIQGNVVTTLETILQVSEPAPGVPGTGAVTGTIVDSFDATVVSGVTLNFRDGINTTAGDIVTTTTTDVSGVYTVPDLPAGNYTAEATVTGADPAYFTVTVIGGQKNDQQDAAITPNLSPTAIRIVLTWGSGLDLDSHLTGPILEDRFHVYWYWENIGSSTSPPFAKLDIDDKDYGPETITIYQQYDGVYRYSVHDHSNIVSTDSTALSNSSAQVKVYRGATLLETFNVPVVNGGANLWTVFEMTGDTITPVNSMRNENNSLSVQ